MRRPRHAERGHVLAEAMLAGALVVWALSGIMGALAQGQAQLARAVSDQLTNDLAAQKAEELVAAPLATWIAAAGTTQSEADVGGHPGWSRSTAFSGLLADDPGTSPSGAVPYYEAVVTVTDAQGRQTSLRTLRWKGY